VRWVVAIVAMAGLAFPTAASAGDFGARDLAGNWRPPPSLDSTYTLKVTAPNDSEIFGQITDVGNSGSCLTDGNFILTGDREGAFDANPTYRGTSEDKLDPRARCGSGDVNIVVWSPAANRMRICPGEGGSQPVLDTQSPVDQSPSCIDYRRVGFTGGGPSGGEKSLKYIYRFRRDSNRCPKFGPRTYSVRLGYVAEDPAARFKIWMRKRASDPWREPELYEGRVPFEGEDYRVATVPWRRKGAVRMRVRVYTESGAVYGRKKRWAPCHG
jgi:hypothetical protein